MIAVIGIIYTVKHFKEQSGGYEKFFNVLYKKIFKVDGARRIVRTACKKVVNDIKDVAGRAALRKVN